MSNPLNAALALAHQAYEELVRLASLEDLARAEFGSGAKRTRIQELLRQIDASLTTVHTELASGVSDTTEPPVLSVPAAHKVFYDTVLRPHGKALQRAHLEIGGLGFFADFFLDDDHESRQQSVILDTINCGLELWDAIENDEDRSELLDRGLNIERARDVVSMPWFRPDDWLENLRLLQPVLVDRPPQDLRIHVRYRLTEIYRAFGFGLWMAAIALSRSLVEFSLSANAARFGISTTVTGISGRQEDKSLKRLGEEVSSKLPELAQPIETVREAGNRILHPKKRDVVAHPAVMRNEALGCISATRRIVEVLYSREDSPSS